jgi:hypothetical protein
MLPAPPVISATLPSSSPTAGSINGQTDEGRHRRRRRGRRLLARLPRGAGGVQAIHEREPGDEPAALHRAVEVILRAT